MYIQKSPIYVRKLRIFSILPKEHLFYGLGDFFRDFLQSRFLRKIYKETTFNETMEILARYEKGVFKPIERVTGIEEGEEVEII